MNWNDKKKSRQLVSAGILDRLSPARLRRNSDGSAIASGWPIPQLGLTLEAFTEFVSSAPLVEIQELHTRTFELQAIIRLNLGHLLFGDDCKRTELLMNLSEEHSAAGNDCGFEPADHLPNVIRLLLKMQNEALKPGLIEKLICPGLKKMIREFDLPSLCKKNEAYLHQHKTLIAIPQDASTLLSAAINRFVERDTTEFWVDIPYRCKIEELSCIHHLRMKFLCWFFSRLYKDKILF